MMSIYKEISIHYHPQDGTEWATYLQSKFGERKYQISIALNDVTADNKSQESSNINMFLITPDFLESIDLNTMKGFDNKCSLAILMGVDAEDFTFIAIEHGMHDVKNWLMLDVDGTEESVRHLIMTIVSMYEYDYPPPRIRPVLTEVIDEGLKIYIGLEKKADSDVSIKLEGTDKELKATFADRYFYSFSLTDEEALMFSTFSVICKEEKIGEGQIRDITSSNQRVKPTEGSLTAGHASGALDEKQQKLQQLWELLEEEIDPISMLCQCMGILGSDRKQLDRKLANEISLSEFKRPLFYLDNQEDSSQATPTDVMGEQKEENIERKLQDLGKHQAMEVIQEPILTEETLSPAKKKKGFFYKLLKRKYKLKKRVASDSVLDSVRQFQGKNRDDITINSDDESSVEGGSGISRNSSVSSLADSIANEEEKVMHTVLEDTKDQSKKKMRLFLKNAKMRKSLRLKHAMRDKNISYPSLPTKKPGHL
ncbi:hypothetical protein CHS0354_019838 [Potamilus streckersoni]|uniref:Uncharacterized protein n=1 Tax=Potamilus streckersoni TaxID=2493646 RepID=A0AAE0W4I3_9BIVA|nr:hypothetical protein CHS0354_019838 [Potamilus streckersoni]